MPDGVNVDFSLLGKPPDFVGDFVNSFKIGQDIGKQSAVQNANALFAKSPQAGVNAMTAIDPIQGAALQTINQGNQDRATSKAEAGAEASGDWEGAKAAAAAGGKTGDVMDLSQHIQDMSDQDKQDAADHAEKLASVQNAIMNAVPMPPMADPATQARVIAQRKDMATHVVQASGYPPDQVAAVQNMDFSDAGMHASIMATLALKDQLTQQQEAAQQAETHRHNLVTENAPKFSTVGADQTLVQTAGGGSPQATGGSSATGGAPMATLSGPVGQQVQAAAQGMNATPAENAYLGGLAMKESSGNPDAKNGSSTGLFQFHPDTFAAAGGGNINDVGDQTKAALTLARQNGPALQGVLGRAPTPGELYLAHQQGIGGAKALLAGGDGMTAVQALTPIYAGKYGPRAAAIAQQAVVNNGGSPTMTASQFAQHVEGYFGGGQGAGAGSGGSASSGSPSAPGAVAGGPGTVIFRGANVAAPNAPVDAAAVKGLTGPTYLATLPGPQQSIVKALSEGRMALPSGFALSKPYWQQTLQQLSQYDPSFDTANPGNNSRMKTRAAFTSGVEAKNVTSINTVVNHLGSLYDNIDRMGNGPIQPVNALVHGVSSALGNQSYEPFEADKQAVSSELVRTLRGASGNESDIKAWQQRFDATKTPAQLKAVAQEAVRLIAGRLQPLADQYNGGMGTNKHPFDLLRPDGQAVVNRIVGGQRGLGGGQQPAPRPASRPATVGARVAPTGLGHLTQAQLEAQALGR